MQDYFYKQVEDGTWCIAAYAGDESEVVIPGEYQGMPVTILYDDLFKGHEEITSVRIPDSVTDIGGFVFDGCTHLTHVTLPASLENMWQYAFARSGIEEVTLPEKVRQIVPFTFKDCKNLRKVVCNSGLREIGAWAFDGCDRLAELMHEPGVKIKISPLAFETLVKDEAPAPAVHPRIRPV